MATYMFDGEVAKLVGVNAAVLFQNISWWVAKNAANSHNIEDGKAWTYSSVKAFSELFGWMTERQIRNALAKLEEAGLVETGCFNRAGYDRTKWYTVGEEGARLVNSICQKGQNHLTKTSNGNDKKGEPIPVINTVINTVVEQERESKHKHGEYSNVLLTDSELSKLQAEYPDWSQRIERLSEYIASTGKAYKSHYATIRAWARKDRKQSPPKQETNRVTIEGYWNRPISERQPWEIAPEGMTLEEAVGKGFKVLADGTRVPGELEWKRTRRKEA